MKTTIEFPPALLQQARRYAREHGLTFKAVLELGLRKVLDEKPRRGKFKLRDGSFKGEGMQPEFENASWEQIRAVIYEGRGG